MILKVFLYIKTEMSRLDSNLFSGSLMKYVKLGIWCMMLLPMMVLAQTLDLQTTTNMTDINSSFGVTVVVEWIQWGDVSIAWIEDFEVVSQSRSQSMQIINGRQSTNVQLNLNLKPKEVGTFTLGPAVVQIPGWNIASQSVNIEVDGESLFGSSSAVLDTDTNEKPLVSLRSFNWIGRIFGALVLGLIVRVFQVARRKKSSDVDEVLDTVSDSLVPSEGHVFAWSIQQLLTHARQHTDIHWATHSIWELRTSTKDGALAWLLKRIEQQTYSDTPDPLLEEDCTEYLQDQ